MKIYDIDREILNCVDDETGEIIDFEKFEALQMARNDKIDNLLCWYKELLASAEAKKKEKEALSERQKQTEEQAERVKSYISNLLAGNKFETARNKVSWRKSTKVDIISENLIPVDFKEEIVIVKISKDEIKKAVKNGIDVPGAVLIENNNIQIK